MAGAAYRMAVRYQRQLATRFGIEVSEIEQPSTTRDMRPARKARKNVPNPFKPGELMDIAAKPASTKIKVRPLKNLKDMV